MVRRTADTMAAATFSAVANAKCRVCPVQTSCPVSGKGRQVVEPTDGAGPGKGRQVVEPTDGAGPGKGRQVVEPTDGAG
jgi:hypothetical protein